MNTNYNRRGFVKLSATALAGSAALLSGIPYACSEAGSGSTISVWDVPGGDALSSPDYEVTIRRGKRIWRPITHYTYSKGVDKIIDHEEEGKFIKLGFRQLHSNNNSSPEENKDTFAHSWACFDFSGGPVDVEIKILKPFSGLTLPLKSCGVFPSHLGIDCEIVGEDVIRFTVDKPAMLAVVPNHILALEKLESVKTKEAFEGYRNPLFLFIRTPEANVPSKKDKGTIVIKPGQMYGVEDFKKANTIYFEAGIHDYSKYNPDDPNHYIQLEKGQTVYLEGGAYVYAIFSTDEKSSTGDKPTIRGRGTISGDKQPWTGYPAIYHVIKGGINLDGIQITDPHNYYGGGGLLKSVAALGGWHGNTDGIRAGRLPEPNDGWNAENCFCFSSDTNTGAGGNVRIKNHTVWQLNNAEPLWIGHSQGSIVDGFNVLAYNRFNTNGQVFNFVFDYRRTGSFENVITVRNATIDAPFIPRLFLITSSLEREEVIYKDVLFENIIVNTPYIRDKSTIGLTNENSSNFGKIVFRNLVINGVKVTSDNCLDYFVLLHGVTIGKEIIFE